MAVRILEVQVEGSVVDLVAAEDLAGLGEARAGAAGPREAGDVVL